MARIDLVDLAHSYSGNDAPPDSFALKPVTMTWRQGGAYALLGPSGCGKTTLSNLISGIVTPSRGKILFDGTDITQFTTAEAQHRAGVPVPGHLRHHDGRREPRIPLEESRRRQGRRSTRASPRSQSCSTSRRT